MNEKDKNREKLHKTAQELWREIFYFLGEFEGTLVPILIGAEPGLTKKVLTKKFGDKTITVTIEIEED